MENFSRFVVGPISKNAAGLFEVYDLELGCGCTVELEYEGHWVSGQIELDGESYVFVSHEAQCLAPLADGMEIRFEVLIH